MDVTGAVQSRVATLNRRLIGASSGDSHTRARAHRHAHTHTHRHAHTPTRASRRTATIPVRVPPETTHARPVGYCTLTSHR